MNTTSAFTNVWGSFSRSLLAGFTILLLSVAAAAQAADGPAGKQIFLKAKCNKCHEVSTEGVGKQEFPGDDEEDEEEESDEHKPPDLAGVGERHTAEFIDKFIQKKESIEGRKHKRRFKGSETDRKALVDWLAHTRPDPKAKPAAK